VVPAPANVTRHFLDWERPLLAQAVARLAEDWSGEGPLDLSRLLVVVPTLQSGRRLRAAIADHAASRRRAALPPRIATPGSLVAPAAGSTAASPMQALLAWVAVLRGIEPGDFREVFPLDPPARGFAWALRLAGKFTALQSELAEVGLGFGDVPGALSDDRGPAGGFPEAGRWTQLGALERLQAAHLAARGLTDPQAARIAAAERPDGLPGIGRVVVLATPDPIPLSLKVLAAHARSLPVEVVVFAPAAEAAAFDEWGRPLAAAWERRPLLRDDFERRVHLCADPAAQADQVAALAREYATPDGLLAAGIGDPEVLPLLEGALARAGIESFNPEGSPRRGDRLHHLLSALAALAGEPSFEAVGALARCPDFIVHLQSRLGPGFSPARWLRGIDELRSRHLPPTLAAARSHAPALDRFPDLDRALAVVDELRETLVNRPFAEGASGVPALLFGSRGAGLSRAEEEVLSDCAAAWMDVLDACAAAGADLSNAEWWELALRVFGEGRRTGDKPPGALELQGWLELAFEDAPRLVVVGMNDGSVPDAVVGDPFLPESLREALGLKSNAARLARDAYLLAAIAASRAGAGRLDLLLGKVSAAGDPLRPSRLLLRCDDADLPARVRFLFRETQATRAGLPWNRAWTLLPPPAPRIERVKVTAFRDYLRCPFRFYLAHALNMGGFDPQKAELDPMDFGTLCHAALEAMGRDRSLRDCTDPRVLGDFLQAELDRLAGARYGAELALPVIIQLESARQRLSRAAEVQAGQRRSGWVVDRVESGFSLKVGDVLVHGKIDRVERHEGTGRWRVIDFKTSDTPVSAFDAHSSSAGRNAADAPAIARFEIGGNGRVWKDLQLPLYLEALEGEIGDDALGGYFNLPKAGGETAVDIWDGYDGAWRAQARRCFREVAAAIAAGVFWPPAEIDPGEDTFPGLFHQGTRASINPAFGRTGGAA
jgi:ATP-dependent helicase/nuclease subunit B